MIYVSSVVIVIMRLLYDIIVIDIAHQVIQGHTPTYSYTLGPVGNITYMICYVSSVQIKLMYFDISLANIFNCTSLAVFIEY